MNKEWLNEIEQAIKSLDLPVLPDTLYEPFRYTMAMGGKRIRPYLTLLSCGMVSGNHTLALPSALSVEILHNFTLVHDDIMDEADTRRGIACVHKKWDTNIAILSGDVMYAYAFKQLLSYRESSKLEKEQFAELLQTFVDSTIKVCDGQALDMEFMERSEVSVEDYFEMIEGKTGALLAGALAMGAIVGGRSDLKERMTRLGNLMGVAFQIQDDLLDIIAEPEDFGKKKAGDIREGKKTYLWLRTFMECTDKERNHMLEVYTHDELTDEQVHTIISMMEKYGIIEETSELIDNNYRQIYDIIGEFEESIYRTELSRLIDYLRSRIK